MTCILTDEEIEEAIRSYSDGTLKSADRVIANAAARKALEMAARECEKNKPTGRADQWMAAAHQDCADDIRELAGRFE